MSAQTEISARWRVRGTEALRGGLVLLCTFTTTSLVVSSSSTSAQIADGSGAGAPAEFRLDSRPVLSNAGARRDWEARHLGDPRGYAERLLLEQEHQRALYPAQVPAGRLGEPLQVPVASKWISLGPTSDDFIINGPIKLNVVDSGRLNTILPDSDDPDTVYVLASGGGLWKTTSFWSDSPKWKPLTDSLIAGGGGAAAFGSRPKLIHLGLGDAFDTGWLAGGAMTRSTDGGETWTRPIKLSTRCGTATSVRDVKVDAGLGGGLHDIVLVTTDVGIFRSADGGATYNAVLDTTTLPYFEFWSLVKTSAGWLATGHGWDGGKLFLSVDQGATWQAIADPKHVLTDIGRTSLAVGMPGDNVVYALAAVTWGYDQRDLFRSTDGGHTWAALNLSTKTPTNPNDDQPNMDILLDQAWYNQLLLVDPGDPSRNTIYIGGELSSARSTDGGNTWTLLSNWLPGAACGTRTLPYVHADFHTAAILNNRGRTTLFFGTDGGLFVSTNNGASWDDKKNIGLVTHLHYSLTSNPNSPDSTITGLQDLGTRVCRAGTSIFDQTLGGDGMGVGTSQNKALVTLGSTQGGNIQRSTDLGWNWSMWRADFPDAGFFTPVSTPAATADPSGQVFFTAGLQEVYRTIDGGLTWSSIGSFEGYVLMDWVHKLGVSPVDVDHVAVLGYYGSMRLTANGGASWTELNLRNLVPHWSGGNADVAWANNTLLYVASRSPYPGAVHVARSQDGGATWAEADTGLPDLQVNRVLVDPSDATGNTVYAGTWLGVYRTTDGGATWSLFGTGLPQVRVMDMYMPPDCTRLRIATYGHGIWEIRLVGHED